MTYKNFKQVAQLGPPNENNKSVVEIVAAVITLAAIA
jgi:hypothetical protein